MKKKLLCTALMICATASHAEYTLLLPKGVQGGVSETTVTHTDLSNRELEGARITASAYAWARVVNVTTRPGQPVTVSSYHTICFETFLTTEADYTFTLDVGGKQSVAKNHIVIPARQRTCVSHQLYQNVAFASPGNYQYFARSNGYTMSSGNRGVATSAFVFVK